MGAAETRTCDFPQGRSPLSRSPQQPSSHRSAPTTPNRRSRCLSSRMFSVAPKLSPVWTAARNEARRTARQPNLITASADRGGKGNSLASVSPIGLDDWERELREMAIRWDRSVLEAQSAKLAQWRAGIQSL